MKKNNLKTAKKLTRENLKTVLGGQGNCTPGHFVLGDFDPTIPNEDGTKGNYILLWEKGTC